jgi:beta-1,4-mannosyl-glycoprotein beta-1,4-N-acetylglucosaminyltransferase
MKVTFFTLANIRPDFIEIQYRSIKKFVKDADVEYVIFNNASENRNRFNAIEAVCKSLGVTTKKVRQTMNYENDASAFVGACMNSIWQDDLRKRKDLLVYIDSDMFLIDDFNVNKMMEGYDFAFAAAYRGKEFEVLYPWTGLMFFNMNTLPHLDELVWQPGSVLGHRVDVGGLNHHYLKKYPIKTLYLEMWNMEDVTEENGVKKIMCSINGNIRFTLRLDAGGKLLDISTKDPYISASRSFPYQPEYQNYYEMIKNNFLYIENFFKSKKLDLPHPFWFDFFKTVNDPIEKSFIYHYKSAGNWLPFYTEEYNRKKTRQLYEMLYKLGVIDDRFRKLPDEVLVPTYPDTFSLHRAVVKAKGLVKKVVKKIQPKSKVKPKVYDVFSFFNELDMLELRLNILDPYVDCFVIVEATETFSGLPKKLYYEENKERFKKWQHKIIHYVVSDYPNNKELINLADSSPNVPKGAEHWRREFYQKESLKRTLATIKDISLDAVCYVGDVDEIWNYKKKYPSLKGNNVFKLELKVYSYYLNLRSDEKFAGPIIARYETIKNNVLNHLRTRNLVYVKDGGWHFTNMGGADQVRKKLESYGHQEFNNDEIKKKIEERIAKNEDFIGRKFKLTVDEKDLPEYILKNKETYKDWWKKD